MANDLLTEAHLDTDKFLDQALLGKVTEQTKPEGEPPVEVDEPAEKPAVETPVVETPAAETPAPESTSDVLDSVKLGAHARPATAEAFSKVKELARAELRKREEELATLRKQVEERASTPAQDEQTTKELEELRNFRESIALEADPKFVERFDKKLDAVDQKVFAHLKSKGATDENIAQIKEWGGIEKIALEKLTPEVRRYVEARLTEKEDLREQRTEALSKGAETRQKFLEEQRLQHAQSAKAGSEESAAEYKRLASTLEGFKPIAIPAKASAEEKKTIEEANRYIATKVADAEKLLSNDNPKTRAELAAGYALAHVFLVERDGLSKKADTLQKQLADTQEKLKAYVDAGKTVRTDPRPTSGTKPKVDLRSADEAMAEFFQGNK